MSPSLLLKILKISSSTPFSPEDILNMQDVGYNEKNKAEEFMAYVNYKLGT